MMIMRMALTTLLVNELIISKVDSQVVIFACLE
jgi:hypothetical protein